MRSMRMGTNVTVFLLFFALALMEAMGAGNWVVAVMWLAFGALFLLADNRGSRSKSPHDS